MGINVNVSTQTTPGLLPVEQPDVTGSWDNPMVMLECVWGFSNQVTYGDYNEVTIGGYLDVCFGVLLEVVIGATVEIISPLAVEVILPVPGLQPLLAVLGSGPAMAAATKAGWAGRTSGQGGDKQGLQYDVVFGNYVESVSELKFKQHSGDAFDSEWVKTVVADSHVATFPAVDHVECIGFDSSGGKTLVSGSSILFGALAGPFSLLAGQVKVASTEFNIVLAAMAGAAQVFTNGGAIQLSATPGGLTLAADGAQALIATGEITISAETVTFSSGEPAKAGAPPVVVAPIPLAAQIIAQAEAAASAATAWAASAAAEIAAAESWPFGFPDPE
jgi:hypothetical protein